MNTGNKRKEAMDDDKTSKRVKKVCSYGETCFRRNPAHFREFSHPHLESILDAHKEGEDYPIPPELSLQRHMIQEQLEIIVEKKLYEPVREKLPVEADTPKKLAVETNIPSSSGSSTNVSKESTSNNTNTIKDSKEMSEVKKDVESVEDKQKNDYLRSVQEVLRMPRGVRCEATKTEKQDSSSSKNNYKDDPNYRPILPPTRKAEEYLKVVRPRGQMAEKHKARAPYYIFYTTITDAKETHSQPYSITFQEILDSSLGELKCSLQINFMVEIAWLLAQYYFAGYSLKKLTILYGDDCTDMRDISKKKPQVEAVHIKMPMPFGTHHTKMMILCYEDGSLRVVISTANLYLDDWENRTQGLWFSPSCPELPPEAMPHDGESPTLFKKYLLKYLNNYHLPQLAFYVERVKRCDFSHINVFLVSSAPGSHFDADWGLTRVGALLRQHCAIPRDEHRSWNFLAQASSLGSFGKEARLWLTGDFLHNFSKIKEQPQTLSSPPELKLIYPSLENVRQSHDNLLGGGCLPYGANVHMKQTWLNNYMYQWKATSTNRNKAMPHIKCYTRVSVDCARAGYFVLSSANVSKAAWGGVNKGDGALRLLNYEAGVLLLPRFVINEDFFPLKEGAANCLILPYDVPPVKFTADMSPWVSDYLR